MEAGVVFSIPHLFNLTNGQKKSSSVPMTLQQHISSLIIYTKHKLCRPTLPHSPCTPTDLQCQHDDWQRRETLVELC